MKRPGELSAMMRRTDDWPEYIAAIGCIRHRRQCRLLAPRAACLSRSERSILIIYLVSISGTPVDQRLQDIRGRARVLARPKLVVADAPFHRRPLVPTWRVRCSARQWA